MCFAVLYLCCVYLQQGGWDSVQSKPQECAELFQRSSDSTLGVGGSPPGRREVMFFLGVSSVSGLQLYPHKMLPGPHTRQEAILAVPWAPSLREYSVSEWRRHAYSRSCSCSQSVSRASGTVFLCLSPLSSFWFPSPLKSRHSCRVSLPSSVTLL